MKTYSIENEEFKVTVKEAGAELCSLLSKKSNREYIWQADPAIWGSSAPVLFPNIGNLKKGGYQLEGKKYQLPKHGIVRGNSDMKLVSRSTSRMSFALGHNEQTLKSFPFEFEFKVNFLLNGNKLQVFHEIVNLGKKTMSFALGGHPALNCLWKEGESLEDYFLEFAEKETASILQLGPEGLLGRNKIPFLKSQRSLVLDGQLFDKDALIFTDLHSSEVTLKSRKNKGQIKMNYADFPYLGIWSKPGAPYVCLEPWSGLPDYEDSDQDWMVKPGNQKLLPGNTYFASYQIQVVEP